MRRSGRVWEIVAFGLLTLTALAVLRAPVFPSQDGPVHLYYVDVLGDLLRHTGAYSQDFEVKSLLTPYVLEYYSLLLLQMVFSAELSEKLLICVYLFGFGLAFRYLLESVGAARSPWLVAGIAFSMNGLVYLGFLSYCLGVALTLFLIGQWLRGPQRSTGGMLLMAATLAVLLLTHPLPVAIFLLFAGTHLAVESYGEAQVTKDWAVALRSRLKPLLLLIAMGIVSIVWVAMFRDPENSDLAMPSYLSAVGLAPTLFMELTLTGLLPFSSHLYTLGPMLLLLMAGFTLVVGSWRREGRLVPAALSLIAISALCFVLFVIVPQQLNGSWSIPERFPVFWIMLLIAAAAALRTSPRVGRIVGVTATVVTIWLTGWQWRQIAEINSGLTPALQVATVAAGSRGLIVGSKYAYPRGLNFDPYLWGGVHYFRRSKAILLNQPWLNNTHIMVGPVHAGELVDTNRDEAAELVATTLRQGGSLPPLDFLIESADSTENTDAICRAFGVGPGSTSEKPIRILRRP